MDRNADIVRRLYEAFNRRDTPATRELMDPEIQWVNPEDAVEPGIRQGFDQYQDALGRVRDIFRDAKIEVDRLVESGDRVAAAVRMHVRARGSGLETEVRQSHMWTLRAGRAIRFEWFSDPDRALKGLPDGSPRSS
jgi:ketosteroid isomerase-like protein